MSGSIHFIMRAGTMTSFGAMPGRTFDDAGRCRAGRTVVFFEAVHRRDDVRGHLAAQAARLLDPELRAEQRAREHQASHAGWPCQQVLDCEHAAPGVSQEVDLVERERVAKRRELVEEGLDGPERGVVRPVRAPASELVVPHHRSPIGQICHQLGIGVARDAWTAVQQHEGRPAPQVASGLIPGPVAAERHEAVGEARHRRAL